MITKLSSEGLRDNYHSTSDQIALKNLQSDVTEAKSDFTKETLASQNTKMISSLVISQMIDENKDASTGSPMWMTKGPVFLQTPHCQERARWCSVPVSTSGCLSSVQIQSIM
uniref:Chromosome 10 open reading frame 90 n=1 Tax=Macaca fascicularis TaxID=9541 RepID=A0A2K5VWD4_MACFA